jgi:hypothetical protein
MVAGSNSCLPDQKAPSVQTVAFQHGRHMLVTPGMTRQINSIVIDNLRVVLNFRSLGADGNDPRETQAFNAVRILSGTCGLILTGTPTTIAQQN